MSSPIDLRPLTIKTLTEMMNPNRPGSLQVILAGGKLYEIERGKTPQPVLDSKKKQVIVK